MRRRSRTRLAATVSVAGCGNGCDCGAVSIRLHDSVGEIFAAAQMPPETARSVIEAIEEALRVRPAGLGSIRCEGTA